MSQSLNIATNSTKLREQSTRNSMSRMHIPTLLPGAASGGSSLLRKRGVIRWP